MPYADYRKVHQCVQDIIDELNISAMPIDPKHVLAATDIPCISYSEVQEYPQFNDTIENLRAEGVDAYCYKNDTAYIVFFDDKVEYPDRIPFSIAHELGHIALNHHSTTTNGIIKRYQTTSIKDWRELEADEFAGELLAPTALIHLIPIDHPEDIRNCFKVSYSCATVALNKAKNLRYASDQKNINFYKTRFRDYLSNWYCPNCHVHYRATVNNFCPICGQPNTLWANFAQQVYCFIKNNNEVPIMKYRKYKSTPLAHILECPRCGNEDIRENWSFCPICGLETANNCTACGALLEPHHRYCAQCGKESTYYKAQALVSWEEEKSSKQPMFTDNNMPF